MCHKRCLLRSENLLKSEKKSDMRKAFRKNYAFPLQVKKNKTCATTLNPENGASSKGTRTCSLLLI